MTKPRVSRLSRRDLALSRRQFVARSSAAITAAAFTAPFAGAWGASSPRADRLKIGVIGCGGRGTGAAVNALEASSDVEIFALGDAFPERMASCRKNLGEVDPAMRDRVKLADDRCFTGFDAYKQVLASGVDSVILATPPTSGPRTSRRP